MNQQICNSNWHTAFTLDGETHATSLSVDLNNHSCMANSRACMLLITWQKIVDV